MHKQIISLACMILIVSLPLVYAIEQEEYTAEEGYTDIIINVNKYEPSVIVSSLLEEQNIPIYAFLSGIPTEGLDLPRIQSVSVSLIGGDKDRVSGGVTYVKPGLYSWDDLGHLVLKLKKVEKRSEVPDEINLELKANIRYEADVTSDLIGGREEKEFEEKPIVYLDDFLTSKDYNIFGGKGRVQVEKISGDSVTFAIYYSSGDLITRTSARLGSETSSVSLVKGSNLAEDIVRLRVNEIVDKTLNTAVINIDEYAHTVNVGREVLGWTISKINIGNANENYVEVSKGNLKTFLRDRTGGTSLDEIYSSLDNFNSWFKTPVNNGKTFSEKEFKSYKEGYDDLVRSWGKFELKEIKAGEKPEAEFNLGAVSTGEKIGDCSVARITEDRVTLNTKKGTQTLRLISEEEKERYYTSAASSSAAYQDELSAEYCGSYLYLRDIYTKKSVKVSVLSGQRRGYTETIFNLHLPVEKRAIELSARALDKKINQTRKNLERWNKNIDRFEKIVKNWQKVCLYTAGFVLMMNFFSGWGGVSDGTEKGCKADIKNATATAAVKAMAAETKTNLLNKLEKGECNSPPFYKFKGYTDTSGKDLYVYGNNKEEALKNLDQYYVVESGNCVPITSKIVKSGDKDVIFDWTSTSFKEYTGVKELGEVKQSTIAGESAIIVPVSDPGSIPVVRDLYIKSWRSTQGIARKGLYAVIYKDRIDFWQGRGDLIDVGDDSIDKETDDPLQTFYKSDVGAGKSVYDYMENKYVKKLTRAQASGSSTVDFDGVSYKIKKKDFNAPGLKCECIMAKWKCTLLYNACDPVICPPNRCNFGGEYQVESVIKSGFVGSTTLCLHNSVINGGDVLVPFCLSGFLASMKNIRSYLQGYERCLVDAKVNDKSTGICDKIESIFICEFIWEETLSLFKLKGGLLGMLGRGVSKLFTSNSGASTGVTGISSAVSNSEKTINYFTSEYAKEITAAFKGRTSDEIRTEVCKSAIAGKFPNLGEFIEEYSQPEDPVQYTAWFEEHPYSTVTGESRYQVYYHIYAGTPRNERIINYKVYLKSPGKAMKIVNQGSIGPGGFADETVNFLALSGYQQICVNIDGNEQCNFGKIVSTSSAVDAANDWWMVKYGGLAPDVKYASQCVSQIDTSTPSIIPQVAVERRCGVENPGVFRGEESSWTPVGRCDVENGKSLGICWQKAGLDKYPELKLKSYEEICKQQQGGVWCGNSTCPDGAGRFLDLDLRELGHSECCIVSEEDKAKGKSICEAIGINKTEEKSTVTLFEPPAEVLEKCPEIIHEFTGSHSELDKIALQGMNIGEVIRGIAESDKEKCNWKCTCLEKKEWECLVLEPCTQK